MGAVKRDDSKRSRMCCVCGTKKSKAWHLVNRCATCSAKCTDWLRTNGLGICAWHGNYEPKRESND